MKYTTIVRLATFLFVLAISPFLMGFGPPAYLESDDARTPLYTSDIKTVAESEPPDITSAAAVAIDGETGQILFDKNAHARRAPASMTKVTTAIVALENGKLDDSVSITVNGWAMQAEGSSVMGLNPGDEVSLKGLLVGLMIPSGNDAALAIAQKIGGTTEHFVDMMNAKIAELGLTDTHYMNPHGLDADGHYSSAFDVAQLARYAMHIQTFADIVKMQTAVVDGQKNTYYMKNTNPLLGIYKGADGVKTGLTENAGNCLVASASRQDRRVFVTMMDSKDRTYDGTMLFDYAFDNWALVTLALPQSSLWTFTGTDGQSHTLRIDTPSRIITQNWLSKSVRAELKLSVNLDKEVNLQQQLGEVIFYSGDNEPVHVPVYASNP